MATNNVADIVQHSRISKIAFGSCHKNKYATNVIWNNIVALQPQAFLWTGDSIYPPMRGTAPVDMLQREYNSMLTNTTIGYNLLHPPLGIYGIYDDHDWGGNDVGKDMPNKMERKKAFFDFLGYNDLDNTQTTGNLARTRLFQRQGAYHSIDFGPTEQQVKVIFLDTRWFRDNYCIPSVAASIPFGSVLSCISRWLTAGLNLSACSPNGSMLGEQQWTWLQNELAQSQAKVHIVVSSVQVLTTNPVMESWGHFPTERNRLLELLNGIPGTILLSGDVHHGEILDLVLPPTTDAASNSKHNSQQYLYEITSSGLTHSCTLPFYGGLCEPLLKTFHHHRIVPDQYYIGKNFGTIDIDWKQLRVQVNVHDVESGKTVLTTGWKSIHRDRFSPVELKLLPTVMDGHLRHIGIMCLLVSLLMSLVIVAWFLWRTSISPTKKWQKRTKLD